MTTVSLMSGRGGYALIEKGTDGKVTGAHYGTMGKYLHDVTSLSGYHKPEIVIAVSLLTKLPDNDYVDIYVNGAHKTVVGKTIKDARSFLDACIKCSPEAGYHGHRVFYRLQSTDEGSLQQLILCLTPKSFDAVSMFFKGM